MSEIEWTDKTWNPVVGCSRVSAGCEHCYAETMAARLEAMGQERYAGLTVRGSKGARWTGKVRLAPEVLDKPLHWRKPRRIFVNSMSDLFHEDVPAAFVAQVLAIAALAERHTIQILTKRAERARDVMRALADPQVWNDSVEAGHRAWRGHGVLLSAASRGPWPPPNVWIGASVEDQATAGDRIPLLLQTPAAVRFLSCEPLLGPLDLRNLDTAPALSLDALDGTEVMEEVPAQGPKLDWIIVGGESGNGARSCHVEWIRSIVAQCREASVPVFVKQLGARPVVTSDDCNVDGWATRARFVSRGDGLADALGMHRKGADAAEWPEDLRVREWPA